MRQMRHYKKRSKRNKWDTYKKGENCSIYIPLHLLPLLDSFTYAVCMSQDTSQYSVGGSENEYMDVKKAVLKNKKDISDLETLQLEEEKALAKAYETLFEEVLSDTPITTELILYIHQVIFGDLYEWAGRWRTVTISKPGVTWPPPDYLNNAMDVFEKDVLSKFPAPLLQGDESFCEAVAHIQGEFLAIHPFREGNARTIKLVTNILAEQVDRPFLLFDESERGKASYIDAAKEAILKNYNPMTLIISEALLRAIKQS
jgi:cell filamentation protein